MSTRLNFGVELTDIRGRTTLPARHGPYWEVLSYGRALGYQRISRNRTYWVARIRLRSGKYRWRRIAGTNDRKAADGIDALSYHEARLAAEQWFSQPNQSAVATDTFPVGIRLDTTTCPIGDVYTIGHAIRDYLEWKKVAAARSHYATLISYVNHHILPPPRDASAREIQWQPPFGICEGRAGNSCQAWQNATEGKGVDLIANS